MFLKQQQDSQQKKTLLLTINDVVSDADKLSQAAAIIRRGGLVAFPTETVYGLGANALDPQAVKGIFAAKGRPQDNPLIIHLYDPSQTQQYAKNIPPVYYALCERFSPGPLTVILPKRDCIPMETSGGLDTVAVRIPSHPVAREIIRLAGVPVAAPSANLSGSPSPTTAQHCVHDLWGRVDAIVDGGACGVGLESTVISLTGEKPVLLRPGAVTPQMLRELLPDLQIHQAVTEKLQAGVKASSPGMKYKHYAPKADLTLVEPEDGDMESPDSLERMTEKVRQLAEEKLAEGFRVGIICTDESRQTYPKGLVRSIGSRTRRETVAHNLYALLREFDDLKADYIFSESFPEDHLGQAIMNRLSKAAGYHIVKV